VIKRRNGVQEWIVSRLGQKRNPGKTEPVDILAETGDDLIED
jgi:hypothetical protein